MLIKDILINNAKLIQGAENQKLTEISIDTRTIKRGETYLGIKGERFDGSSFYEEALKKGASTCILNKDFIKEEVLKRYPKANIIEVSDTKEYLKSLAKKKRETINIPIIAVTGSVGKTTTKNMIASVLASTYKVKKTKGNLNTDIGLCLTILSLKNEEFLVLEMAMDKFGEIRELTNIAKPNIGVITNIGTAHIGSLGSRENILKAKLEILEGLNGPLIINNDNDLLYDWYNKVDLDKPIITYGIENTSDYQALNIAYNNEGSSYTLNNNLVKLNVLGKHFIYNSLVTLIIADLFHVPKENVLKVLNNLETEANRMELIKKNYTIINDTYNASYDSIYYALEVLSFFKGVKVACLGDILELGDYSEDIHRQIGSLITKFKIDYLVTVGNASKYINEEAIKNGFNPNNCVNFLSNKEAISYINNIKNKTTILVKASHAMNFKEIVDSL